MTWYGYGYGCAYRKYNLASLFSSMTVKQDSHQGKLPYPSINSQLIKSFSSRPSLGIYLKCLLEGPLEVQLIENWMI